MKLNTCELVINCCPFHKNKNNNNNNNNNNYNALIGKGSPLITSKNDRPIPGLEGRNELKVA